MKSLWSLIRGRSVIVSKEFVDEHTERMCALNDQTALLAQQAERIARYDRRAAGQRRAAQARAERAKPATPPQEQT